MFPATSLRSYALKAWRNLERHPGVGFDGVFGVALESKFLPRGGDVASHVAQLVLFFLVKISHKSFIFNFLNDFFKKSESGFTQYAYKYIYAMRKFGRW